MDDIGRGDPSAATRGSIFGAGLKRKRIDFVVPAPPSAGIQDGRRPFRSVGDRYLSIVLKDGASPTPSPRIEAPTVASTPANSREAVCEICHLPVELKDEESLAARSNAHDISLAHQVCLEHSYPPSHLDRDRRGLKYLSSYGWDPDSRLGLGAAGEGRRAPVRAKVKNDTAGLGVTVPEGKEKPARVEMLDAGRVRKREIEERRKRERLQEVFYRSEDVERYLGTG